VNSPVNALTIVTIPVIPLTPVGADSHPVNGVTHRIIRRPYEETRPDLTGSLFPYAFTSEKSNNFVDQNSRPLFSSNSSAITKWLLCS
jgi:hypothetical protein